MNELILMNRWCMLPCVNHCPSHFKIMLHWIQRLYLVHIVFVCVLVCVRRERDRKTVNCVYRQLRLGRVY